MRKRQIKTACRIIATSTIIWAAGVQASPAGKWLGVPVDRAGRVQVAPDLSLPGAPNIFAVGDVAHVHNLQGGEVPGIAPAAKQMGSCVARLMANSSNRAPPPPIFLSALWRSRHNRKAFRRGGIREISIDGPVGMAVLISLIFIFLSECEIRSSSCLIGCGLRRLLTWRTIDQSRQHSWTLAPFMRGPISAKAELNDASIQEQELFWRNNCSAKCR